VDLAPIMVSAIRSSLLGDGGVGISLIEELSQHPNGWGHAVELLDGDTQDFASLGRLAGRPVLVLLDAVAPGSPPGAIQILRN